MFVGLAMTPTQGSLTSTLLPNQCCRHTGRHATRPPNNARLQLVFRQRVMSPVIVFACRSDRRTSGTNPAAGGNCAHQRDAKRQTTIHAKFCVRSPPRASKETRVKEMVCYTARCRCPNLLEATSIYTPHHRRRVTKGLEIRAVGPP